MFLTPDELVKLTGRQKPSAQVRVLRGLGVVHKVRPDGTVAVLSAHVKQVFGVVPGARMDAPNEPDWSAVA